MTTTRSYAFREISEHAYLVRERLGGRKAGVYGTAKRRYLGDGRFGANYDWLATAYSTGAERACGTRARAGEWLGNQKPVPATIETSGTLPDTPIETLRAIAAGGKCAWVDAGCWAVIGPVDVVTPGAELTVSSIAGKKRTVTLSGVVELCSVDGHELAWAEPEPERRRRY